MRRRLIVFCLALLVVTNLFFVNGTYAWFTSGGTIGDGRFDSGQVLYESAGEFVNTAYTVDENGSQTPTKKLIVPGSVLVDESSSLSLKNKSTVNTKLKMEITFLFQERPGSSFSGSADPSPSYRDNMEKLFSFTLGADWKLTVDPEELDSKDQKRVYYYGAEPEQTKENQGKVITPAELTDFYPVIASMTLSEDYEGFQLNEQLLITVRFYARQSEYLDSWGIINEYSIGI